MRKILFRGKALKEGKWIFGNLTEDVKGHYRIQFDVKRFSSVVIPSTVGQFTGLTDKNGKDIYEGDIIQDNNGIGVIMWFQTSWGVASYAHGYDGLKSHTAVDSFYSNETKEWDIIGNIHDNPSLLTNK